MNINSCSNICFKKNDKKDLFLQTPIRKLGFLNEAGEALRPVFSLSKNPIVNNIPNLSYIVSGMYFIADVVDKYKNGDKNGNKGIKSGIREALYQGITSAILPMLIVKNTDKLFKKSIESFIESKSVIKFIRNLFKSKNSNLFSNSQTKLPLTICSAALSLIALNILSKPVDILTKGVFHFTVDPILGLNKNNKPTGSETLQNT